MSFRSDRDRWREYLFESHPEETLREWARRLCYFRFVRAYGGHSGIDGDQLMVAYRYDGVADLHRFFGFLGIALETFSEKPSQPTPGVKYRADEYLQFASLIPGTEWIGQPSHSLISGQRTHIWCSRDRITITLSEGYDVVESSVVAAERIEEILPDAPLRRIEPLVNDEHCICPKHYPDYFL